MSFLRFAWVAILSGALAHAATRPQVFVNEIMYHPPGTNHLEQWFELYNAGAKAVDLSGWRVTKGVRFQFPAGTIMSPGGYLVVAADAPTFRNSHPAVTNFVAGWTGKLGHKLEISDAIGEVNALDFFAEGDWAARMLGPVQYNHQGWIWYTPADGGGASIELVNPRLPNAYAHNWAATMGGTPGQPNAAASSNAAPFIDGVAHWPKIPRPTDTVSITARIVDENLAGVAVTLNWRVDGQATFQQVTMLDDGAHGDAGKGDAIYGATIAPHPDHTVVEFFIRAIDDAGHSRQYPEFFPPENSTRTANLLYQVDSGDRTGPQPIYRIIMTDAERAELYALGRNCPDSDSDAEMNATWISSDGVLSNGTTTEVRYNAGVRNRGHGTRQANPNNYHVNIPEDRPWKSQTGINLNSQYAFSQVIGSAVMRAAGIVMPDSRAVQVRVNSTNLMAVRDNNSFGSYAANEQYDGDFIKRSFPLDSDGNAYRGIRDQASCIPSLNGVADLRWRGAEWSVAGYTNAYFKQNNYVANDWSDLIQLLSVLNLTNGTTSETYVTDVQKLIDVREWMRYMAANILIGNEETTLATGIGDDYALYRGILDPRFKALPYDLDSVMGRGRTGLSPRDNILKMTNLPAIDRFMKNPEFAPIYYQQLKELAETVFHPDRINPLIDQLLGGFVPADTLELLKSFNASQRAYVLSQIPLALTATASAEISNGYYRTTNPSVLLNGSANAAETRLLEVNGQAANWIAWNGTWFYNAALNPGINRFLIRSLDANRAEVARTNLDVWFDNGNTQSVSGNIIADAHWSSAAGPFLISSSLTIASGATLTIDPGTTVYLGAGANLTVANGGRLLAEGSALAPIRFTRAPGAAASWGGILIQGSVGSPESRITYSHIEFNGTTAIHSSSGTVLLDHLTFGTTDKQYVSLDSSSFTVSHCHFPTPTAGFEPAHGTGGVKSGGRGIFYRNFFGAPTGYNDVVDFTGGQRGGPIVYFLDNVFAGGGDDALDLDGTDAWVENNIFLHIHQNGAPDSSSAVSGGDSGGNTSEVTVIGNIIFDCDQAATAKQGNFFALFNNTIVRTTKTGGLDFASGALNVRDTTPDVTTFARGFYAEGNIISDAEQLVRNYDPAQTTVTLVNNILPVAWAGPGSGNYVGDPLLRHIPTVAETQFNSWEEAQILREWFSLRSGSPARGTGPHGKDQGAIVSPGVYLAGAPSGVTPETSATLSVGISRTGFGIPTGGWPQGAGYLAYKWRIDSEAWSAETPLNQPIVLSGLAQGTHLLQVVGKTDAGLYEDDPAFGEVATATSVQWTVDTNLPPSVTIPLRINEILAKNTTITNGVTTPDLVELYNYGSTDVDLAGMLLSGGSTNVPPFIFPSATVIHPGDYLVLSADAATNAGFHLGFNLDASGDSLFLQDRVGRLIDLVAFGRQVAGLSLSRSPGGEWTLGEPTFGRANIAVALGDSAAVRINEWLANAEFAVANSFVELYNTSNRPIALGGHFFSDAAGAVNRFPIPPLSFIGGNGFTSWIADGSGDPGHLGFKLSADVGQIQLSDPEWVTIDLVSYGPQTTDVSVGRSPDGAGNIEPLIQPTPGAPNPGTFHTGGETNITRTVTSVIALTNTWRYNASGNDLGSSWRDPQFNDSSWSSGAATFYHGNAPARMPIPVATQLPFTNPQQATFYFRTHFTFEGSLSNASLSLTELIDDGAVIYLNGTEVSRRNLPLGAISASTFASSTVSDATLGGPFFVPATGLVAGDNVLAIEVHQSSRTSTDIAMAVGADIINSITNIIYSGEGQTLFLNEVLARSASGSPDWLEIYNASTNRIDLSDISLTDTVDLPGRWRFPSGSFIEATSFLVIFFDPLTPANSTNTAFGLDQQGGTVYLFDAPRRGGSLLDSVRYGIQVPGLSIGRVPDVTGAWTITSPTFAAANHALPTGSVQSLRINEWLANPSLGDDWFEIYNPSSVPVALSGLFLTDDLADRAKFHIAPLSFIAANGFLRFEADGAPGKGALHADFNLSSKGEEIGLYDPEGAPIDSVTFGAQVTDISEGRLPDGSENIVLLPAPSPGSSNSVTVTDSDQDGLPDQWEISFFNTLARNGSGDFDADGMTDAQEFLAGTSPASASDHLGLAAAGVKGGAFLLHVQAVAGKSYRIEFTDALSSGIWSRLTSITATATGQSEVSDPSYSGNGSRFYRVRLE